MDSEFEKAIDAFIAENMMGESPSLSSDPSLPSPVFEWFCRGGLCNWWIGQEFGGRGFSLKDSVQVIAKLAYAECGIASAALTAILSSRLLEIFGTKQQQQNFLVPLVKTGGFSALAASEIGCGSELLGMSTVCTPSGTKCVLNGRKAFSTSSAFADFVVVVAKLPDDEGFTAVIVPKGTPGMIFEKRWNLIGLKSCNVYGIQFVNCEVPVENMIEGNGLRVLEVALNASRILIAATGIGMGRRIRDLALDYGKNKILKGSVMLENPVFAAKLGQMEMEIETMNTMCRVAAEDYDTMFAAPNAKELFVRTGIVKSAIVAKLLCGQMAWHIASTGSEMFGGTGYSNESLMFRLMSDIRHISIVEGGEDVARDILYGRYVKNLAKQGFNDRT